ncbi:hypothetical protein [Inhella gelatinilytica]|uniref:Uncharacterized protein n=1 Tax=Inhella gelatinilytica TaxID=2795030 RepID=A0A931IWL4_9BURK|nr:hypothetical protein [Inhella gelatinilytica]MBH9551968.1 hypothetical protein [Inhella gelatinilytica]
MPALRWLVALIWERPLHVAAWALCMWPLALGASFALMLSVYGVAYALGIPLESFERPPQLQPLKLSEWLGTVGLAPLLESMLLAAELELLRKLGVPGRWAAVVGAISWGLLHGLVAPVWFFGTVCSFYLFSVGYWRYGAVSFEQGLFAAMFPHALVNATAMTLVWALPA